MIINSLIYVILLSVCIKGKVKLFIIIFVLTYLFRVILGILSLQYYEFIGSVWIVIDPELLHEEWGLLLNTYYDIVSCLYIVEIIVFIVYIIKGYIAQAKHNRLIESDESYKNYVEYVNSRKQR